MNRGDRVKIAAWTDTFMRGELYAEVIAIGPKWITVRGERSARTFKFGHKAQEGNYPALTVTEPYRGSIVAS